MPRAKRRIGATDAADKENANRPAKAVKSHRSGPLANASNGQRFGQETDFIPLSQTSSSSQIEDDDAGANDLIQSSQYYDDVDVNEYDHYGEETQALVTLVLG